MFFGKNKSTKSLVCKWFRNVNPRTIHLCVPSSPSRSRLFRRVYLQRDPVWVPSDPSRSRCNIFGIPACGCTGQSKYPGCLITRLGKYLIWDTWSTKAAKFIALFSSDWTNQSEHRSCVLSATFTCTEPRVTSALSHVWSSFTCSCVNELKLFKLIIVLINLWLTWRSVSENLTLFNIFHFCFLAVPERCNFVFKRT